MTTPQPSSMADLKNARVRWVQGQQAVRAALPLLQTHGAAWRQETTALEAEYALSQPTWPRRRPLLLLAESLQPDGEAALLGAILLFAYGDTLFGDRLVSNGDRIGRIGVFGPAGRRLSLAVLAANTLLEDGAALVRIDFALDEGTHAMAVSSRACSPVPQADVRGRAVTWRVRHRERPFDLPLCERFDDTLQRLGRRTRRNIRLGMRQCGGALALTFESSVHLSLAQMLSLNRAAMRPVSSRLVRWRHESLHEEHAFLAGLRDERGDWVAVAAGRRFGATVAIDWQMALSAHAAHSLSLVMRGYMMQHFGAIGAQRMYFEGATSHVMADHFSKRTVFQVEARRHTRWLPAVERAMLQWFPRRAVTRTLFGAGASSAAGSNA